MKEISAIFFLLIVTSTAAYAASCNTDNYHPYLPSVDDALSFTDRLKALEADSDGFASVFSAGFTAGGKEIKGILISKDAQANGEKKKPAVLITGAIHANEWPGAEAAIGLAQYLVDNRLNKDRIFSRTMTIANLLEKIEVVIIPVLNPDGYEYSRNNGTPYVPDQTIRDILITKGYIDLAMELQPNSSAETDPIDEFLWEKIRWNYVDSRREHSYRHLPQYADWRKNRSDLTGHDNYVEELKPRGVDLNRNFSVGWNLSTGETYTNPASYASYHGKLYMSEKEVEAYRTRFEGRSEGSKNSLLAVIDYHSGKQIVLYPYGCTDLHYALTEDNLRPFTNTNDEKVFKRLGKTITDLIASAPTYTFDPSESTYGNFCGIARDWVYRQYQAAAFNIELSTQFQPAAVKEICNHNRGGALWLLFWAADRNLKTSPTLTTSPTQASTQNAN